MAYEDHAQQHSVLMNLPEILAPFIPDPLVGEVKAGAAHPDQVDAVSVLANAPETPVVPTPVVLVGEVAPGASFPGELPPSVIGTTYD